MQTLKHLQQDPSSRRRGFTLVELMVVIGIIAFLAGLVTYASMGVVSSARHSATRALVVKLDRLVETRREAFDRFIEFSDRRSGYFQPPEYMTHPADRTLFATNPSLAVYIARKRFYQLGFPQRFADWDTNFDGTPDAPFNSVPASHLPETESSEMLYWFLTNAAQFGADPVGTGEFSASEVRDTDGDGLPEFVDAWGTPLRFYRWPTRLIRPQPPGSEGNPQTQVGPPDDLTNNTFADPDAYPGDPNHEYVFYVFNTYPPKKQLGVDLDDPLAINTLTPTLFENNFHTKNTWHRPLIISAGPDRRLGLHEPTNTAERGRLAQPDYTNIADLNDNISSLNLRSGGR